MTHYLQQIEALSVLMLNLTLVEINFAITDDQFAAWYKAGLSVEKAFIETFFISLDNLLRRKSVVL